MGVPTAFTASLNGLMLGVTPDNVLAVRDTLQREAVRLQSDYNLHHPNASHLPELGPDPVSTYATPIFNARLPEVVAQFKAVIDEVKATVDALTEAAHSYGLTESAVADTLHGIQPETQGVRQHVMNLATGPPAEGSTGGSGVPGLAADTPAVASKPAPIGVDPAFIRSALEPNVQVGMTRP